METPRRFTRRLSIERFLEDELGIAITEYGMLIALMALALIAVLAVFGGSISSWFAQKTSQITTN